ncbi:MAG: hypothetical protein L0Y66_14860 [Myxococcaceae bacterium]|nr:hypothetical protein [Myxococcaceae bacterium]MCI0673909.1 hypothetical protein [Myxococcaceae bacterium]
MELSLTPGCLKLRLSPRERLVAMPPWRELDVPLDRIRAVRTGHPDARHLCRRAAGTSLPGYFYAGPFYRRDGAEFWYAHPRHDCLQLELKGAAYKRLVLEVEAPQSWAEHLRQAGLPVNSPRA